MGGITSFTDDVERIILRQFGNRILWIVALASMFFVMFLNQAQRARTPWPTEILLAMLNLVLEITLVLAFIAMLLWEQRAASRPAPKRGILPGSEGYALKFYIACALVLLVITGIILTELSYFQYIHLLTVLQRGFLVWMTCAILPAVYLLINTQAKGGMRGIGAVITSFIILAAFELSVTALARFVPAMERLGDLYYWNMLYTGLAQERVWLAIYNPWLALYLLSYAGVNIALVLALMARVKALRRRGVQA